MSRQKEGPSLSAINRRIPSTFSLHPADASFPSLYASPFMQHMSLMQSRSPLITYHAVPSLVKIQLVHCGRNIVSVSLQEDGKELAKLSNIPPNHFSLGFQPRRHDVEVAPHCQNPQLDAYFLDDIIVQFLNDANED